MMDINASWGRAQELIMEKVSSISYDLWIKTLRAESFNNGEFVLLAVSGAAKAQALSDRHFAHIESAIREVVPVADKIKIIDVTEKEKAEMESAFPTTAVPQKQRFIPINRTKTFDNFIVGKSNEFVAAAAEAVAKNPGQRINPLFIYGDSGLGKTHLLNAIANYVDTNNPDLVIAFVTCENFLNDYVESLRNKTVAQFREKYRNIDLLLIDDIHTIENKTGTQEEFFHTFNDLYQNGRQIVLTSDRHADKFQTLEERMRTRFKSGLIQDITSPDAELRRAILEKKAAMENKRLAPDVAEYLASRAHSKNSSVREMEGDLFKVVLYAGLKGRSEALLDDCFDALQEVVEEKRIAVDADTIIERVCKYFNVPKEELMGKKRNREIVEPRMIAIHLMTEILNMPLANIGKLLGGRDHTTVLHSRNKIVSQLKTDKRLQRIIEDLENMVRV